MSKEVKLSVNNLKISFRTDAGKVQAVRDISFDLYKGETLAIVGESGSGKSVTSKAIIGILAGNSIVEGGEILYEAQDLLRIPEEAMHKLRGDKIAMIFQDPLSALNPIMKVGKQLTEAMLLKAKVGKKNAKEAFNTELKLLGENINKANDELRINNRREVEEKLRTFDKFCIQSIKIEGDYNDAYAHATQADIEIDKALVFVDKKKPFNYAASLKKIRKSLSQSFDPYVVEKNHNTAKLLKKMKKLSKKGKKVKANEAEVLLREASAIVKAALVKEAPNFFTLGYYLFKNKKAKLFPMTVSEMDVMTRQYLDENFMFDFIKTAEVGVVYSRDKAFGYKKGTLVYLKDALKYFKNGDLELRECRRYADFLSKKVDRAIDKLEIKKESAEHVFKLALNTAIKEYFDGLKANPIEERIYLKNKAKYDREIKKGREPDWILKPQVIVDLDEKRRNMCRVIENLIALYEKKLAERDNFDSNAYVVSMIDFFKEQASRVVVKMNKQIAKAKAIKLLEEVGIPEPETRYKQYPFEFSGGMRQRIVIAIALSANPDILICDEPTTALDVTIQAQILELINDIKRKRNLSVIFITHNLGVVANMADRIAVMYAGKIVEYGTANEIFYEPAHPYTWALLSSMPDLETTEKLESIPGTPPNMIYPPKGDAFADRNKYALEIDFELQPPLFEITPTHSAATWLLHPDAPKVEMPAVVRERIERKKKEIE